MFRTIKKIVKGTVGITGDVVKLGTKAASTVATEVIATPTELFMGRNGFSDGLREVNRGVAKVTDVAIDRVAKPLTTRVLNAPLTHAELVKDVAVGGVQTMIGNREKGLRRLRQAVPFVGIGIVTAGLVDDDDVAAVADFLGIGADSVADAAAETVAETVAEAGSAVADGAADILADVDPSDAADAFAPATALAAASTDAPSSMASHVSHAIRFSGEPLLAAVRRLSPDDRILLLQQVIEKLPASAPMDLVDQLREAQNGAVSQLGTVLQRADGFVNVRSLSNSIRFRGNG